MYGVQGCGIGILIAALSIITGSFLGGVFKERINFKNFTVLSISIMIISLVGFFENMFDIKGMTLKSNELLIVVFALIISSLLGGAMRLETMLSNISGIFKNNSVFVDTAIFFGVGGFQICGPLLLAMSGNSEQLILKSAIDFPFAVMFGICYGKKVGLAAVPVAVGQLIVAVLAMMYKNFRAFQQRRISYR